VRAFTKPKSKPWRRHQNDYFCERCALAGRPAWFHGGAIAIHKRECRKGLEPPEDLR
jgi:hypothetical protein